MESLVKLSILIAAKNEALNLRCCVEQVDGWADEIVVVDSFSHDETVQIAKQYGAHVEQFEYRGGWPKKRQWALDTYQFRNPWILLLDADEIVTPKLKGEISSALAEPGIFGCYLRYEILFLGRRLKFGDTALWKLSLFRRGSGRFEQRLRSQDESMCDMEVHEHVIVSGPTKRLKNPVEHRNLNSLHRYIDKHNQYSTWESRVHLEGSRDQLRPDLFGNQAQRRRWLKRFGMRSSLCPLFLFAYRYILRLGCLDGKAGLYYSMFQAVQVFHSQAKIYEANLGQSSARVSRMFRSDAVDESHG